MSFPQTIHFKSDSTTIQLIEIRKKTKTQNSDIGIYEFTKSSCSNGKTVAMPLSQIEQLKNNGLITFE